MDAFTTYEQNNKFSIAMNDLITDEFDNETALGLRFSFIFIESGSGIALLDGKSIPYIAPCIFA